MSDGFFQLSANRIINLNHVIKVEARKEVVEVLLLGDITLFLTGEEAEALTTELKVLCGARQREAELIKEFKGRLRTVGQGLPTHL